jgi:hypothetical protein
MQTGGPLLVGGWAAWLHLAHSLAVLRLVVLAAIHHFLSMLESASKLVQFKRQKTVKKISTNLA